MPRILLEARNSAGMMRTRRRARTWIIMLPIRTVSGDIGARGPVPMFRRPSLAGLTSFFKSPEIGQQRAVITHIEVDRFKEREWRSHWE